MVAAVTDHHRLHERSPRKPRDARAEVPRAGLAIMVTRRCNMTRAHCSVESGPRSANGSDEAGLWPVGRPWLQGARRPHRPHHGRRTDASAGASCFAWSRSAGVSAWPVTMNDHNGFWGRTPFHARKHLRMLKRAGLNAARRQLRHCTTRTFRGPAPVRNIALAARRFDIPAPNVTTGAAAQADPPESHRDPEPDRDRRLARAVRALYDLQPVGRGNDLLPASRGR